MGLSAGGAGNAELIGAALQVVHQKFRLSAGAGQLHMTHRQGEQAPIRRHALAALGTDIADGAAFLLHRKPPYNCSEYYISPISKIQSIWMTKDKPVTGFLLCKTSHLHIFSFFVHTDGME